MFRIVFFSLWVCLMASASAENITFTDQRGKQHTLRSPVERAVFLPIPHASSYIAIDQTERHVVGMNPASATAMERGMLAQIFPGVRNISTGITRGAGFLPNVESILSLRPDVVFQLGFMGDEPLESLERVGLTVVGIQCCSQRDLDAYTAIMGAVAGKPARAAEMTARQHARLREIEAAMEGLAEAERPRVLYLSRFTHELRISSIGSYNNEYIRRAGGLSTTDPQGNAMDLNSEGTVTLEQVLAWDPEVILIGNFDPAMPSDVYDAPAWAGVSAVRNRRVYRVPSGAFYWDPPSQESALIWTWIARLLHPERARFDLRGDMREWYQFLYQHTLTDDEIDRVIVLPANSGSAGYERFARP